MNDAEFLFLDGKLVTTLDQKRKDLKNLDGVELQAATQRTDGYQEAIDFIRHLCEVYLLD
ncbi:hypothetical protein [Ileibacterium valens]|uniref:hypothetical protein n=1 Tax=Ileibacterium valens TaxID=1862668 RepID=UPI00272F07EE|nr:hypothetical protein [Ileibacterium valens]